MKANDYYDMQELEWWRQFRTRCFNDIPVERPLYGDRFKIMVQDPLTDEWEDVWSPKHQPRPSVDSQIAEIPQSAPEPSGAPSGSPPNHTSIPPTARTPTGN